MSLIASYPSTVLIMRQDGTIYDLGKLGYRVKSFDPPMPQYTHTFQQVGRYGVQLVDTSIGQLTIPLVLDVTAVDTSDFELQRLRLHQIFRSDEEFYVMTTRMPFLRWKVVADPFNINQAASFWRARDVQINLQCASGYAESTATTLTPFTFADKSWGLGQDLPSNQELKYTWTQSNIRFYNGSTIPLLAEERPVKMTFKGTAANGIKLTNKTTKQSINIYRKLSASDTLIWYSLVPTINGKQQYGNGLSDHGYLDFAIGWNELVLSGANDFTITFDTRFYY